MLIGEGYQVVHLSRHGSFEEGKDVLAIAPDGTPCAFQLKGSDGGKISQSEWAKYNDQITRLVEIPIKHPSIDESQSRRVYFVTNGELEEEVRVQITNQNPDRIRRQQPELGTVLKGELLNRFSKIHTDLWPLHLQSEKELLELYLADGTGYLDKAKYAGFIESLVFSTEKPTKVEGQRVLASAALFASYGLFPFSQAGNHVAIIEGWTIFIACAISYIERYTLDQRYWRNTIQIAEEAVEMALSSLWDEVRTMQYFVAGNALVDAPFYRGRLTWLTGFISSFMLLQKQKNPDFVIEEEFSKFILVNQNSLFLWGEAAIPQFLSILWALRTVGYPQMADRLLFAIFIGILDKTTSDEGIPDPYHNLGEIVVTISGLSDKLRGENFAGRSYSMESLIQLLVKREYRGILEENWKQITLMHFVEFEPLYSWQFCVWHCEDGTFHQTMPKTPQSWKSLVNQYKEMSIEKIPLYYQRNPAMLLIFILVYPHRLRSLIALFLDNSFLVTS